MWLGLQSEVADALARSSTLAQAGPTVLRVLGDALSLDGARLWRADGDVLRRVTAWTAATGPSRFPSRLGALSRGVGLAGRVWQAGAAEQGEASVAFPIQNAGGTLGVIELEGDITRDREPELQKMMLTIARQLGERIERERSDEHGRARDALLAQAERAARAGSFEADLRSGSTECSAGLRQIAMVPDDVELTLESMLERVHPDDRELARTSVLRRPGTEEPLSVEVRVCRFDGEERIVRARGTATFDDSGRAIRLLGTVQDVTDEAAARAGRDLLSYVVDSSDDAILTYASDGTITTWNRGAERLYGYTVDEAIGQAIDLIEPAGKEGEQLDIVQRAFGGESIDHLEATHMRKDGTPVTVSLTVSPVRHASSRIVSVAIIARDITELKRDEERLRYLADRDQLTGLYNRRRFDQELKRELARAGRRQSHSAVLSIDIDNFKVINDSAGHAAGDVVLSEVASALSTRFRSTDVVARLGGDEFGVLMTSAEVLEAKSAGEDLLRTLRRHPTVYEGMPFRITASIGVTAFDSDEATASDVLVNADLAMYAAKAAGRDQVVVYTPAQARKARAMAKLTWSQRIQDALEHDRFVLHLQPILELSSGEVSHGELLLRMRGDRGRLIAPGAFLPAAERFGMIHAIDRWVVQQAIAMLAGARPGQPPRLCVNLSAESVVGDPELLTIIERRLNEAEVDPAQLIFEITETAAIANMPEATSFARSVTGLGCSLALDDFGTGFGSFYYLKYLPVRYVKLDGEFIQNLPRSEVDEHMVRAIVGVASGMGIKTVAESVADDETIRLLQEHGVDYAQGFHIGRPAPVPVPLA
jgi:diguanylate cyclase (GGDEF)-like protein/PAS domain S-box-containing protein